MSDEPQKDQIGQNEILQMLHRKKMPLIEQRFQQKEKGLPIDDFVSVMLDNLEYDRKDKDLKLKLTMALIDFFREVDVNGDQSMQWQQFSNHIIELGLLRNDRSFKNVIKPYFPSERIVDKEKHEVGIQNIYYFQKLRNLFMIEQQSSKFKVYNVNTASLMYQVNAHKGNVLDLQYLENQNLIATSSNDLTINFWDASSFTLKQIVSVPQIQLKIRYADWKQSQKQLFYTGGSDAIIHIYDALTLKQKGTISGWNPFYKTDQQQQGHSGPIGDILPIDSQQTLASACLSGCICLWDCNTHQLKKELRGHVNGVYSLDWCNWSQMNQCLLSAGLDHQAFVWNTYVKDKIFMLRGHNHPLVGIKCLPETPQIITADISGMVKIWDVRNFLCVQTFNAPIDELSSFCLTYSNIPTQIMKKRIIVGSKKLHYFEYDEPKDQLLTDEKPCISVIFNATLLCIITLHSKCLKVWDAMTGRLQSVYRGLSNSGFELTCMILDSRERKLFVGDSEGCIFTVNIKNGAKMKQFQKHQSAVTGLGYWSSNDTQINDQRYNDLRRIVSISMDSQVYIHDEDAPQDAKSSVRYIIKQHTKRVNTLAIRANSETLATGSDDCQTILTNLISYRHQILQKKVQTQVRHVVFIDPYQCLLNIDVDGLASFYGIGQNTYKNKLIYSKQYKTESMTNQIQSFPIVAVKFDIENQILICGDDFGSIQCWNLSALLEVVVFSKIQKSKLSKGRENTKKHTKESKIITERMTGQINSVMLTEVGSRNSLSNNNEDLVTLHLKLKQAHNDGITSIQIISQNQAFITASFDCCCHIWRIVTGEKIGSLLLGGDPKWSITFNLAQRKEEALQQAEELLDRISKKRTFVFSKEKTQDNEKEYQSMKQGVLKGAKELIDRQKRSFGLNQNVIDILGETNALQKQFFDLDESENYNDILLDDDKTPKIKKRAF